MSVGPVVIVVAMSLLVSAPTCAPSAVVFLHGLADTGDGLQSFIGGRSDPGGFSSSMAKAGIKVLFPTATPRSYRLAGGRTMSTWYDRNGLPPEAPEHAESIEDSITKLEGVLRRLESEGIPPSRVAVGGFSQGGGIALQLAYRGSQLGASLAAVFALSSFATDDSAMWASLEGDGSKRARPPCYFRHGAEDDYILPEWAQRTAGRLGKAGVDVDFALERGVRHEMSNDELKALTAFLLQTVSEVRGSGSGLNKVKSEMWSHAHRRSDSEILFFCSN